MPSYKGYFTPTIPNKYLGDVKNIEYRSMWERVVMSHLDKHPSVIHWASEEVQIPYWDECKQRFRRYFVDFYIEIKMPNGNLQKMLVEVKPDREQKLPRKSPTRKGEKRFLMEMVTYTVNQAKWAAATKFAQKHNMVFEIWGETVFKSLGLKIL